MTQAMYLQGISTAEDTVFLKCLGFDFHLLSFSKMCDLEGLKNFKIIVFSGI